MSGSAPAGPPDGVTPHVLVADIGAPVLEAATFHHLSRVRRLRAGSAVTVTDGRGGWRAAAFVGTEALEPVGAVAVTPRPEHEVTVAFGLTKGVKPDWTVQKLTEIGVDRIVPFRAERSVVQWDESKAAAHRTRMESIARAALEQCHRVWLPEIEGVATVAELAARGAVRADRGGSPLQPGQRFVAVGPEGGWSDAERTVLTSSISLGEHVLRAETAAITAGMVLCTIRSGLVRPVGDPKPET